MIREILKAIWKITKIVIIVSFFGFLLLQGYENNLDIKLVANVSATEYRRLNDRINTLVDNDQQLLASLQENDRQQAETKEDLENNIKFSEKYTIYELSLMRKNINLLYNHIEELQKILYGANIQKILNGSVFVNGLLGAGSGTVIKATEKAMYILTCYHVVDDIIMLNEKGFDFGATVGYTRNDNLDSITGMTAYGAEVIKYDKENDLALLRIDYVDENLEVISIAEKEPEKGDTVYTVGNPLGLYRTISKGIIANKVEGYYIFDGTITFGNSGGGLYNTNNELIGIPNHVLGYKVGEDYVPESGLGYTINLRRIKNFLEGIEY